MALTPDGRRVVSASRDSTLKVCDIDSGRELHTLDGHTGPVTAVALTTDGRRAVSGSTDTTLKVWEMLTGESLATFSCDSPVLCCDFASDATVVAGNATGQVHILTLEM